MTFSGGQEENLGVDEDQHGSFSMTTSAGTAPEPASQIYSFKSNKENINREPGGKVQGLKQTLIQH